MSNNPLTCWLFVACLQSYRHPWMAMEVARVMFDDNRLRYRRSVAKA